jgi:UDP-N-acetylmuramate dehydrogenase
MAIENTLAVPARAAVGCVARSVDDLLQAREIARAEGLPLRVLGEGSNVIPNPRVDQVVCHLRTDGVVVVDETDELVHVKVASGEHWHAFVMKTLANHWYGLENLALIPGSVGAAPIQNIGAYGVEIATFVDGVEILDEAGKLATLNPSQCAFDYRQSVFQNQSDVHVTSLLLKLRKKPTVVTGYPDVAAELSEVEDPTPDDVARAVIAIRRAKLPDPRAHPNAGSFFKNPIVDANRAQALRARIPDLSHFEQGDGIKISAAQLIDRCGWKDRGSAALRCWPTQPLVIVNDGRLAATDVLAFAQDIRNDVFAQFGVQLELEPSVLS